MSSTKYPLIDLVMNDEVARYVGVLERRVIMLTVDNLKLRTLLELLTDESWDDESYPDDIAELKRIATDALVRRLGLTPAEAAATVASRWDGHNPPPASDGSAKILAGQHGTPRPHLVPKAVQAGEPQTPGYSVEKHLAGLSKAAKNRQAQRDQLA